MRYKNWCINNFTLIYKELISVPPSPPAPPRCPHPPLAARHPHPPVFQVPKSSFMEALLVARLFCFMAGSQTLTLMKMCSAKDFKNFQERFLLMPTFKDLGNRTPPWTLKSNSNEYLPELIMPYSCLNYLTTVFNLYTSH